MEKLSNMPIGSNPATAPEEAINNQLNAPAAGLTPKELKDFLNKLIRYGNRPPKELLEELGNLSTSDKIKSDKIKDELRKIGNAYTHGGVETKDPLSGKKDPTGHALAQRLLEKLPGLSKTNQHQRSTEGTNVYNNRIAQTVKKKKKTRGNPFRVLMGKVGKLLDHGVEKNDIVRYLAKLKYWNNETIERAVDIVRDYNKKKKKDTDKYKEPTEKEASSNSKVVVAALDYDREPDFHKKSTGELIYRACFLLDVLETEKDTVQPLDKPTVGKKEAKAELALVKKALVDRGLDQEELLLLGIGK
jgi:hypothetical protein